MSTTNTPPDGQALDEITTEMRRKAPLVGPNASSWPGLTLYRLTAPQPPQWDEVGSLTLGFVAQGRKAVRVKGFEYRYDPFHYLVFNRGLRFQAEILEASVEKPFLSFVLNIDPATVLRVSARMRDNDAMFFRGPSGTASSQPYVSPLDRNLTAAILKFLRVIDTPADRLMLGQMYLQEVVYRLLQAEQCHRLVESASKETSSSALNAVIDYVHARLGQPVTVNDLARHVSMSPSAFAHSFRDSLGVSPYQFVKRVRLERARTLLAEERLSVSDVARDVGYSSLSHFSNDFKRRFGTSPRRYADLQTGVVALNVGPHTTSN